MSTTRKLALAAGIFYLLTFAFSPPTLVMKARLHDPAFVLGAGDDTGVVWAALFDRVSRTRSLGFVTSRVVEAGILVVGALAILAMVTLHQDFVAPPTVIPFRPCYPTSPPPHRGLPPLPARQPRALTRVKLPRRSGSECRHTGGKGPPPPPAARAAVPR